MRYDFGLLKLKVSFDKAKDTEGLKLWEGLPKETVQDGLGLGCV